jgi:hypothetical protein
MTGQDPTGVRSAGKECDSRGPALAVASVGSLSDRRGGGLAGHAGQCSHKRRPRTWRAARHRCGQLADQPELGFAPADGWQPFQYNVYVGTSPGGEPPVGGTSSPSSSTSYTVTGLASGTTYYFKVSAVYGNCADPDGCVESAQSTEAFATTTAEPVPPAPPTGLTATAAGSSRVSLSWTAPAATAGVSVTGYKIYAGPARAGSPRPAAPAPPATR